MNNMNTKACITYIERLLFKEGVILGLVERQTFARKIVKYLSQKFYHSQPKKL